jgi:hypothetical protein
LEVTQNYLFAIYYIATHYPGKGKEGRGRQKEEEVEEKRAR